MVRPASSREAGPFLSLASTVWQFPIADGLVLARPDLEALFFLNPAARLIWEAGRQGSSPEDIIQGFVALYGIPAETARRDVFATLAEWSRTVLSPLPSPGAHVAAPVQKPVVAGNESCEFFTGDYILNGKQFRVSLTGGDLVAEVAPRLELFRAASETPPCTLSALSSNGRVSIFRDEEWIGSEETAGAARAILLQEMTRLCEPGREWRAILHAAACGTPAPSRTGAECVLLAGASHSGKSTLSAALMGNGLLCYSDDSAVIDQNFRAAAMPFPLTLREGSWSVLGSRLPAMLPSAAFERGGVRVRFLPSNIARNPQRSSSPSARIRALLFVDYQAGASGLRVQPMTAFDALMTLQVSGFWVKHDRDSIAGFLAWLESTPIYKMTYAELDEAIQHVQDLLSV